MYHIYGILLDDDGRCSHYHSPNDIVALKCGLCQRYYACYQCHDQLEDHPFVPISTSDKDPVLCGHCGHTLSFNEYQKGYCGYCQFPFNPRCKLHQNIYFKAPHPLS